MRSSVQINGGAVKLTDGSTAATNSLAALPAAVNAIDDQLRQARAVAHCSARPLVLVANPQDDAPRPNAVAGADPHRNAS